MKLPSWIFISGMVLTGIGFGGAAILRQHERDQNRPAQRSDPHSQPPPGYAIQTNGQGQWRWFRVQHGDRDSWAPMDSRQDAVENAWIWYNYDHAEQQTWRLETPAPDPNTGLTLTVPYHEPMPMIDNNAAEYGGGSGTVTHTNEPQPSTELKRAPIIRTGPAKGTP